MGDVWEEVEAVDLGANSEEVGQEAGVVVDKLTAERGKRWKIREFFDREDLQ